MLPVFSLAGLAALSLILDARYASAANDWDTPCLNGSCTYESGDGNVTAYHLMVVNGTSSTVSDITPAAGWTISGCNANSTTAQTVQLTCDPSRANAANCAHLLTGNPVNKVIRLPESCGAGPFARVASWSNSTTATPNGAVVQTCTFDYNFTRVPATQTPVSFSVYGSSAPGVLDNQTVSNAVETALQAQRRSFPRRGLPPRSFISSIISAISAATQIKEKISATENINFAPGKTTVLIQSLSCDRVTEKLTIAVDPSIKSRIDIAFAIQGQLIPPKVDDIALSATLKADAQAIFDVVANVNGVIASDLITLFSVGLPGLNIPGVFSVGPTFSINTQVKADLGTNLAATIAIQETFDTLEFIFPPSSGKSSLVQQNTKTAPKLSIAATGTLAGDIRADLIPKIDFGVNVLDGLVDADVFLQADLAVDLKASVSASRKPSNNEVKSNSTSTINGNSTLVSNSSANGTNVNNYNSTSSTLKSNTPVNSNDNAPPDVSFSGSVELDFIVDVTAGANAKILEFDPSTSIDVFDKTLPLFQKSFGSPNKRKLLKSPRSRRYRTTALAPTAAMAKRSLTCSANVGDLSVVV